MAFTDAFTDADTTQLISHTPTGGTAWTLQVGLASEAVITGNECDVVAGGSQSFHSCDDQGSADCYTEIVVREVTNYLFPACLRATKVNALNSSWIGIAIRLNKVEVWKQNAGTFTKLGLTGTTTVILNDVVRITANGNDISVTINGVAETSIGTITEAFNNTVTMQGIATRASGKLDGFKAGVLAPPATYALNQSNMRGGFNTMNGGFVN